MSQKKSVFISLLVLFVLTPMMIYAKRGSDDESRKIFIGVIQSIPSSGLQGEWIIGGQTFSTASGTEFDQTDGSLTVGGCAKAEFKNGVVHEIDSEPMSDCK